MDKISTDRQDYYAIDLIKFCMAIFVVAIHTGPFEYSDYPIKRLFTTITEIAVPFFFVTSGFLLFRNAEWKLRIGRYAKRMVRLYVVWNIVYLPISIFGFIHNGVSIGTALLQFVRGFFLIGQQFYSWHLWYVLALIYAAAIFYSMKRTTINVRYFVSLALFVIGAAVSAIVLDGSNVATFYVIVRLAKQTIINGRLFMGIGYFALGMLIAEKKMRYNKNALIAVVFGCIVSSYIIPYSIIVFALRYVTVFCLFLLIIQINLPASSVYVKLRHSSKVVYFTHMLFFFIWSAIKSFQDVNGMDAFVIVTSMTVVTSLLINAHKDDKRYNRIYNVFFG